MTKYFCDVCGKEIGRPKTIGIPCHFETGTCCGAYVDNDMNYVSDRIHSFHVCNKCNNELYSAMMKRAVELGYKFDKHQF